MDENEIETYADFLRIMNARQTDPGLRATFEMYLAEELARQDHQAAAFSPWPDSIQ